MSTAAARVRLSGSIIRANTDKTMKNYIVNFFLKLLGIKIKVIEGRVRTILEDVNTGEKEISEWKENLIVTTGKVAILRRLANIATISNAGIITYGAVGTGTATPVVGDTKLGTELDRVPVSIKSIVGSIITLQAYFTTAEGNGDLTEFGWFGEDATNSADSGTMFNRILISKTKTAAKTLTIEQTFEYA